MKHPNFSHKEVAVTLLEVILFCYKNHKPLPKLRGGLEFFLEEDFSRKIFLEKYFRKNIYKVVEIMRTS